MNEDASVQTEDVEEINYEQEKPDIKDSYDDILNKISSIREAIELHNKVKNSVLNGEVDNNYLNYIENSLEDKLFDDVKFDKLNSKVLLEVICPCLITIEAFDVQMLDIEDIGNHYEEDENYIDKICTYNGKFICLFGVNERKPEIVIKYEPRKFSRTDMVQAICKKLKDGEKVTLEQYDEYYVVTNEDSLKVFSERKMVSLVKLEETVFDKMKNKLWSLFNKSLFSRKTYLPNIELIYDNNLNRFKDFKNNSKTEAKSRMKKLLIREREVTREV